MEDEVKISLDRIKKRTHRIKTMPPGLNSVKMLSATDLKRHNTYNKNVVQAKKVENKFYLPELNQMVH